MDERKRGWFLLVVSGGFPCTRVFTGILEMEKRVRIRQNSLQRDGLFLIVRKCEARESCVLERYRGFLILNVILDKILC